MEKIKPLFPARVVALACSCILCVAAFRFLRAVALPELPNFSPVVAIALCGGLFLPGALAWIVPLGALFISDMALSLAAGFSAFGFSQSIAWVCIAGVVWIGRRLADSVKFSISAYFGALLGGSVGFYLITNTAAWLLNPAYPRGFGGLWMSLTTGIPGYPPSWVFFRNSLFSDLLFGAILLAICAAARRAAPSPVPAKAN